MTPKQFLNWAGRPERAPLLKSFKRTHRGRSEWLAPMVERVAKSEGDE